MSYTRGYWKYSDMRQHPHTDGIAINAQDCFLVVDHDLNSIAKVNPAFPSNAKLIAAAPELLDALKRVAAQVIRLNPEAAPLDVLDLIKRVEGKE